MQACHKSAHDVTLQAIIQLKKCSLLSAAILCVACYCVECVYVSLLHAVKANLLSQQLEAEYTENHMNLLCACDCSNTVSVFTFHHIAKH